MSEEDRLIEQLILNGGVEPAGVDSETGEILFNFTPKIQELMPELYNDHLNEVNNYVMDLWVKGFLNIDFLAPEPIITVTEKSLNKEAVASLSKKERWNLFEIMRVIQRKN